MSPLQPQITYVVPCVVNSDGRNNIDEMKMDFTHPDLCLHFLPTAKEVTIE